MFNTVYSICTISFVCASSTVIKKKNNWSNTYFYILQTETEIVISFIYEQ